MVAVTDDDVGSDEDTIANRDGLQTDEDGAGSDVHVVADPHVLQAPQNRVGRDLKVRSALGHGEAITEPAESSQERNLVERGLERETNNPGIEHQQPMLEARRTHASETVHRWRAPYVSTPLRYVLRLRLAAAKFASELIRSSGSMCPTSVVSRARRTICR